MRHIFEIDRDRGTTSNNSIVLQTLSIIILTMLETTNENDETGKVRSSFDGWERCTSYLRKPLLRSLIYIARLSAKRPFVTIAISILVSALLSVVGLFTNFRIENEGTILWTPTGCNSLIHGDWVASEDSGFPQPSRNLQVIVHANGGNVLGREGADRVFDVIDTIRATTGYHDLCSLGRGNEDGECPINAVTGFWANHNRKLFEEAVQSDEDAILAMSALRFANGEPALRTTIYGLPEPVIYQNASILTGLNMSIQLLESVSAYLCTIGIPPEEEDALPFEAEVTDRLFELDRSWANTMGEQFTLEINSSRSYDDELYRSIKQDIPLMAAAFAIMGVFCSITLAKRHGVRSQSLLGVGAVATIALGLLTGYGLMFCVGVPFTSLAQIFPYVMVGIGLDDTFILTGAFARTDPKKDIQDRVEEIMHEVGISISASTLTTFCAFMLGSLSSLPGIRWFAFYSAPSVLFDFVYQVTFFIALLAIDDLRQKANRRDCCPCCTAKPMEDTAEDTADEDEIPETLDGEDKTPTIESVPSCMMSKIVDAYPRVLLRPITKIIVLITFSLLLVLGCVGASKQSQKFDFRSLTPPDSFVRDFYDSLNMFFGGSFSKTGSACYFRDIDVSVEANQLEMFKFVDDMTDMEYISNPPTSFWLRDFLHYRNQTKGTPNLAFFEDLDAFLNTEPYSSLYKNDVHRNDEKQVTASRVRFVYDNVNGFDIEQQIEVLAEQSRVAKKQPLNGGTDAGFGPVFSFDEIYYAWELYTAIVGEIVLTVILGLASVFVIALVFVPHAIGALLVTPVVGMVYVELLAILWVADIYVNSVSAIGLTMSIGLVVDYNMHIVLTYFEVKDAVTRDERVKKVLKTMGKSIMLGGFSTFLGVLPLSFSGSEVFR